jgi:hypothetical protein
LHSFSVLQVASAVVAHADAMPIAACAVRHVTHGSPIMGFIPAHAVILHASAHGAPVLHAQPAASAVR